MVTAGISHTRPAMLFGKFQIIIVYGIQFIHRYVLLTNCLYLKITFAGNKM